MEKAGNGVGGVGGGRSGHDGARGCLPRDTVARAIDVAGPLLHGLGAAAGLLSEIDPLRNAPARAAFSIAYVALPTKCGLC
jgi:hypothetical protein